MKKVFNFLMPILLTIAIFLISYVVLTLFIKVFSLSQTLDVRNIKYVYTMLITASITSICVWLVYKYIHKEKICEMGLKFSRNNIILSIISVIIMTLGFILFIFYTNNILDITKWGPSVKFIYIVNLLLIYLGVSINEEVLFRGYLHKFYKKHNIYVAYLISIPLFLAPHFLTRNLDLTYLLSLFVATLMLTMIYDLSGSIWPGIILHFVVNSYLSLVSLGINSGTIIVIKNGLNYSRYVDLLRYAESIINVLIIILFFTFYFIQNKKIDKPLFQK